MPPKFKNLLQKSMDLESKRHAYDEINKYWQEAVEEYKKTFTADPKETKKSRYNNIIDKFKIQILKSNYFDEQNKIEIFGKLVAKQADLKDLELKDHNNFEIKHDSFLPDRYILSRQNKKKLIDRDKAKLPNMQAISPNTEYHNNQTGSGEVGEQNAMASSSKNKHNQTGSGEVDPRWYADNEINKLLDNYANNNPKVTKHNVEILSTNSLKDPPDTVTRELSDSEVNKNTIHLYPIQHIEGEHYVGLAVTKDNNNEVHAFYADPLNSINSPRFTQLEKKLDNAFGSGVKTHNISTAQQENDYDCGPYTVENLKILAENIPPGGEINQSNLDILNSEMLGVKPEEAREKHARELSKVQSVENRRDTNDPRISEEYQNRGNESVANTQESNYHKLEKMIDEAPIDHIKKMKNDIKDLKNGIKFTDKTGTKKEKRLKFRKELFDSNLSKEKLRELKHKTENRLDLGQNSAYTSVKDTTSNKQASTEASNIQEPNNTSSKKTGEELGNRAYVQYSGKNAGHTESETTQQEHESQTKPEIIEKIFNKTSELEDLVEAGKNEQGKAKFRELEDKLGNGKYRRFLNNLNQLPLEFYNDNDKYSQISSKVIEINKLASDIRFDIANKSTQPIESHPSEQVNLADKDISKELNELREVTPKKDLNDTSNLGDILSYTKNYDNQNATEEINKAFKKLEEAYNSNNSLLFINNIENFQEAVSKNVSSAGGKNINAKLDNLRQKVLPRQPDTEVELELPSEKDVRSNIDFEIFSDNESEKSSVVSGETEGNNSTNHAGQDKEITSGDKTLKDVKVEKWFGSFTMGKEVVDIQNMYNKAQGKRKEGLEKPIPGLVHQMQESMDAGELEKFRGNSAEFKDYLSNIGKNDDYNLGSWKNSEIKSKVSNLIKTADREITSHVNYQEEISKKNLEKGVFPGQTQKNFINELNKIEEKYNNENKPAPKIMKNLKDSVLENRIDDFVRYNKNYQLMLEDDSGYYINAKLNKKSEINNTLKKLKSMEDISKPHVSADFSNTFLSRPKTPDEVYYNAFSINSEEQNPGAPKSKQEKFREELKGFREEVDKIRNAAKNSPELAELKANLSYEKQPSKTKEEKEQDYAHQLYTGEIKTSVPENVKSSKASINRRVKNKKKQNSKHVSTKELGDLRDIWEQMQENKNKGASNEIEEQKRQMSYDNDWLKKRRSEKLLDKKQAESYQRYIGYKDGEINPKIQKVDDIEKNNFPKGPKSDSNPSHKPLGEMNVDGEKLSEITKHITNEKSSDEVKKINKLLDSPDTKENRTQLLKSISESKKENSKTWRFKFEPNNPLNKIQNSLNSSRGRSKNR